jgi:hypothetical protein
VTGEALPVEVVTSSTAALSEVRKTHTHTKNSNVVFKITKDKKQARNKRINIQ